MWFCIQKNCNFIQNQWTLQWIGHNWCNSLDIFPVDGSGSFSFSLLLLKITQWFGVNFKKGFTVNVASVLRQPVIVKTISGRYFLLLSIVLMSKEDKRRKTEVDCSFFSIWFFCEQHVFYKKKTLFNWFLLFPDCVVSNHKFFKSPVAIINSRSDGWLKFSCSDWSDDVLFNR